VRTAAPRPAAKKKHVVKKKHRKPKPEVERKARTPIPNVMAARAAQSGVLGAQSTITLLGGESFDLAALLIVAALSLAIACFGIAAVPAAFVPWRPAAWFVASERLPITFVGLAILAAAAAVAGSAW
jgi:hypothetical protein